MTARSRLSTRVVSDTIQIQTIYDNFERHKQELAAIGATDDDILKLRAAADLVDAEEREHAQADGKNPSLNKDTLEYILAPHECCNGWLINPPSKPARRWACTAILKVTGGAEPTDSIGLLAALSAGLFILKLYGDGESGAAMQLIASPNGLADRVPGLMDELAEYGVDAVADDYMRLMGMQKKSPAMENYLATLSGLQAKCSASSTPPSSSNT